MKSSKRSTDAAGMAPPDLFWAAWGATTLLVQIPLSGMILQDPQSLLLGVWNLKTLALFCAVTFLGLPLAVGAAWAAAARVSTRWACLLLAVGIAYVLTMQINFHYLQVRFFDMAWRRMAEVVLFGVGAAACWAGRRGLTRLLKVCAGLSAAVCLLFAFQAWPSSSGKASPADEAPQTQDSPSAEFPVFFLTFEKLCASYVADEQGRVVADRLPNLAKFASEADDYPETHANCTATVYSLKTLYSGRVTTRAKDWARRPNLRDIVGANRKVVMQLDLLTNYCDPERNVCLRAIGLEGIRGVDLIAGWYKTYVLTILPDPLELRLTLRGWNFNPWTDLWIREEEGLAPGEEVHHRVGRRQFQRLREEIQRQGNAPNLYLMHNFISDTPEVKASGLSGKHWERYAEELDGARRNLAVFDEELGKFFDFLKEKGLYDRSLIVVTTDTGYDYDSRRVLGDAELPPSRDLTRIFFALKRPGQKEGRVFRSSLRHVDVLPTLLAHLGIDPKPYGFEGVPVTDPSEQATLRERPLDFMLTSEQAGVLRYRMDQPQGGMRRVR